MRSKADIIGSALSVGCMIHCLLVPVILPVLPVAFMAGIHEPYFHFAMLLLVAISSFIAFRSGYKQHLEGIIVEAGILGNVALLLGLMVEVSSHHWLSTVLTVLGGIILVGTHYFNHRWVCNHNHCKGNH